jgi:hypothetical protein
MDFDQVQLQQDVGFLPNFKCQHSDHKQLAFAATKDQV